MLVLHYSSSVNGEINAMKKLTFVKLTNLRIDLSIVRLWGLGQRY
jgi:hypothetical protein